MKRSFLYAIMLMTLACAIPANAQYYEIANRLPGLLSPALSGSFNYKGYVEVGGVAGVGTNRANFIELSTSQGFKYSSWFFMGVGIGVDVAMAKGEEPDMGRSPYGDDYYYRTTKTKVMVPVFTDFRFNLGNQSALSAFIDLKLGAAWLIGSPYLRMHDAYLSNDAQFYLKPTVGIRIPVNSQNNRQAFNIGLSYQLLTSNNNYYWNNGSVTLNNFGVTVGYEW